MHRTIGLILITLLSSGTTAQIEPTNCTQTFNYSYTLDELLDQFRDDDIRRNLTKASEVFWTHPDLTIEYIYNALNHEDWQVRQLMCKKIWQRQSDKKVYRPNPPTADGKWNGEYYETIPGNPRYTITPDLIRVTIEGLRHDTTPYDRSRRRGLVYYNAQFGISKLIPIAHDWIPELEAAMESDDPQQQLLAAYILGRAGVSQSVERAATILLPHLRDNDTRGDARFCTYALGGFGPELLPYLNDAMPSGDTQQRDLIALLIVDIMDPPYTEQQRKERSRYNTISASVYDPAAELGLISFRWLNQLND